MRNDKSGHRQRSKANAAMHVSARRCTRISHAEMCKVHKEIPLSTAQWFFHSNNMNLKHYSTKALNGIKRRLGGG